MADEKDLKNEAGASAEAGAEEAVKAEAAEAEAAAENEGAAGAAESSEGADAADTEPSAEGGAETAEESEKPVKDEKDQKIDELTDRYKRLFAEFDNFRKRTDTEKAQRFSDGEMAVLNKVLPLIDNFERAMSSVPEDQKDSAYAKGIEKIYESFMTALKELGVTPIEAKGQPFDANLHNAVMHVEDESVGENIVVEEFQKGYMFGGRVLRYAMVKVAN